MTSADPSPVGTVATSVGSARTETILFVGNSFTFGADSPVWKYRSSSVTDLNRDGVPDFVFIEIVEEGSAFEMSGLNGATVARVGRAVIGSSLPAALMFELSKSL